MPSNPGRLCCLALDTMSLVWGRFVAKYEHRRHLEQSSVRLMVRGLFKQDFDYELADSVSEGINQLKKDWDFLSILMQAMLEWSDADEILQQSGKDSVVRKINACGQEIFGCLGACNFGQKFFYDRLKKFSILLSDCRRMTDALLKEEILGASALEHISRLPFIPKPPSGHYFMPDFGRVSENLNSIMDDDEDGSLVKHVRIICGELKLISEYLPVVKHWNLKSKVVENHAFTTHVISVIVRIAIQSCNFWFNRKDANIARVRAIGLVNLQHQIDPSNPEFMKLILEFQQVLSNDKGKKPSECEKSRTYFCRYMLPSCSNKDIGERLMSLATLFLTTTLRSRSYHEDIHCFFAEALDLFAEAAWLHRTCQENETEDLHSCSYLLPKICILETEFFLKEQLSMRNSVPFYELQILKVEEILKKLRAVTIDICQHRESVLARELDGEVLSLYESVQSKKMTDSMIKQMILQLLFKIVFFKAESFLSELSTSQTIEFFRDNGKEQIELFIMELKYLKQVVSNHLVWNLRDEDMLLFTQVEAVVRSASFLSYSFPPDIDKFEKALLSLPNLLSKVKDIRAKLQEISSSFTLPSFPKTFELGFIDFLGRNIREVLKCDIELMTPRNNLLKRAQTYLEAFRSIFVKALDSDILRGELNGILSRFMELAYKLEYVVESIELDGRLEHSLWLFDLLEDIRLVNEQVSNISSHEAELYCSSASEVSSKKILKDTTPAINMMNVDLVDEEEAIINRLMRGTSRLDVVSIVGMPGIGKTTLAGKVYNSQSILHHFHHRAWCNVSLTYSKRELLLEILSDIHGLTDEIHRMSNEDLQAKLRQCLLKNRYLIVMDDVWGDAVWNDLENVFPNDANRSRILITSRLHDVAVKIKPNSVPYYIRLFSDKESWMLLEKKTFDGEPCPEELLLVGKEIAQHCQGLPLAVVAIAGILRKTEKRWDCWKGVSRSLSSLIMKDPENRCMEILELSYNHLPGYLKVCFLYLGVFLEEKDISVTRLIWFWMAEGFAQETDCKSLEDVAEDYLMELINRSLVIVTKTRSNGKVKACRLHDLLRDLCHSKAKEDFFFQLVTKNDRQYASFPVSDYDMEFHNSHELPPVTFESYRLSIFLKRNQFFDSRPSGLGTRSLVFSALDDSEPRCPYDISFILNNFKLLRVLYLESINMGDSFPIEIGLMVHLRLLAVSGFVKSIPSSIGNLWKLETLIVKGFRGRVILPDSIWSLGRLRHLHVNNHVAFQVPNEKKDESYVHLGNMVSFSTPSFSRNEDTIYIFRRFPNLLKLKCIFLESLDSKNDCNQFPSLEFFKRLESLKIIYHGSALCPGLLNLPLSLKNLTLSSFRLPWSHISAMARLPNLRVLKLLAGAFEGPMWKMTDEEFKELRFLKLEALNIAEWKAYSDHFPRLQYLVVRNCMDLKGIPHDFACINTLLTIEVQWCGQAVEESARLIGAETGEIEILITRS